MPSLFGLLYIVIIATLIGYGLWNALLSRHPSNVVAPVAMLVPVTGVLSSWMFLGEVPHVVELVAGALVVGGVLCGSRVPRPTTRAAMSRIEH